ncbi:MAG: hypothetical protein R2844_20265 [Caldilineales bacterium]
MNLTGRLFWISYQVSRHHWMGAPMDRWGMVGLIILAGLFAIRWLPGGAAGVAVCGLLLAALLLLRSLASRRFYVIFEAEGGSVGRRADAVMLDPSDKLMLRATGRFEVEGKNQEFTELLAYFRSFETREHAVMAICPPSRFLEVGGWPDHEIGMWYMFFKHNEIRQILPGALAFGRSHRPALRIDVRREIPQETSPLDVWGGYRTGKRAKPKYEDATLYLSFNSPEDRACVLADLVADASALD